jgi:hypothetical protein
MGKTKNKVCAEALFDSRDVLDRDSCVTIVGFVIPRLQFVTGQQNMCSPSTPIVTLRTNVDIVEVLSSGPLWISVF